MKSVRASATEGEGRALSVAQPPSGTLRTVAQASKKSAVRHNHDLQLDDLSRMSRAELRELWAQELGDRPPATLGRDVLALGIAYARQERLYGGLSKSVARELDRLLDRVLREEGNKGVAAPATPLPRTGTVLVREWQGTTHHVTIVNDGFVWKGETYRSLSSIAHAITGTKWNGPRFFGMREVNGGAPETCCGR
jgi:hypothetical protein